ncbi:glycosyltransferase family 2 protein [Alphaproteobacteria bacterium]|nr:glycosyltransferase family 2 protein [Alphaproteobacteria bacterium]
MVTIYIPCRNYAKFLAKAVESVLQQLYPDWELFIVNEGSSDDTLQIAQRYCNQHPTKITLINNERPLGLQKLANTILGLANGKYMIRLDADDWLDENALLVMVAKLESMPNINLVYGNYFYTSSTGEVLGFERRNKLGEEDKAGFIPPHGACTMFETRALKSVGGYSEEIDAQDGWELWHKLYSRFGAASIDVPVFYYRQHQDSLSRNEQRLLSARSKILKKVSGALDGDYKLTSLAVIPVRSSYPNFTRIPHQKFGGMSFLQRSILTASQCENISDVIVSSSCDEVLQYAEKLEIDGLVPPHHRLKRIEEDNQTGTPPVRAVLFEASKFFLQKFGFAPDVISFLSLHAVNRKAKHIDEAINVLRLTASDSVVSVTEEREPMFNIGENGLSLLNPGRFEDLFFDRERLYRFNGSIIATWSETLDSEYLLGEKIAYVEMSQDDSLQIKSDEMLKSISNAQC